MCFVYVWLTGADFHRSLGLFLRSYAGGVCSDVPSHNPVAYYAWLFVSIWSRVGLLRSHLFTHEENALNTAVYFTHIILQISAMINSTVRTLNFCMRISLNCFLNFCSTKIHKNISIMNVLK